MKVLVAIFLIVPTVILCLLGALAYAVGLERLDFWTARQLHSIHKRGGRR